MLLSVYIPQLISSHIAIYLNTNPSTASLRRTLLNFNEAPQVIHQQIEKKLYENFSKNKKKQQEILINQAIVAQRGTDEHERQVDSEKNSQDAQMMAQLDSEFCSVQQELQNIQQFISTLLHAPEPKSLEQQQMRQSQLKIQQGLAISKNTHCQQINRQLHTLRQNQTTRAKRAAAREARLTATMPRGQLTAQRYRNLNQDIQRAYQKLESEYHADCNAISENLYERFISTLDASGAHQHLKPLIIKMRQVLMINKKIKDEQKKLTRVNKTLQSKQLQLKTINTQLEACSKRISLIPKEKEKLNQSIEGIQQLNQKLYRAEKWLFAGTLILGAATSGVIFATLPTTFSTGFLIATASALALCALNLIIIGINALRNYYKQSQITQLEQEYSKKVNEKESINNDQKPTCETVIKASQDTKNRITLSLSRLFSQKEQLITEAGEIRLADAQPINRANSYGLFPPPSAPPEHILSSGDDSYDHIHQPFLKAKK